MICFAKALHAFVGMLGLLPNAGSFASSSFLASKKVSSQLNPQGLPHCQYNA